MDGEFMLQPRDFAFEFTDYAGTQSITQPSGNFCKPVAL
jgi:hypothetical protein